MARIAPAVIAVSLLISSAKLDWVSHPPEPRSSGQGRKHLFQILMNRDRSTMWILAKLCNLYPLLRSLFRAEIKMNGDFFNCCSCAANGVGFSVPAHFYELVIFHGSVKIKLVHQSDQWNLLLLAYYGFCETCSYAHMLIIYILDGLQLLAEQETQACGAVGLWFWASVSKLSGLVSLRRPYLSFSPHKINFYLWFIVSGCR